MLLRSKKEPVVISNDIRILDDELWMIGNDELWMIIDDE